MIGPTGAVKVLVATKPVDFRKDSGPPCGVPIMRVWTTPSSMIPREKRPPVRLFKRHVAGVRRDNQDGNCATIKMGGFAGIEV